MPHPFFSVIIPAYNSTAYLDQAVRSVLAQTDRDLELIVIDDGSPEPHSGIMAPYLADNRVFFYANGQNEGVAAARNRGVMLARGEYVAFLDADDWWDPEKLAAQRAAIEKTGTVLCYTARELMTDGGRPVGRILPAPETVSYEKLLRHNCIACSSVTLLRQTALDFPMQSGNLHEDYLCWLAVLMEHGHARGINRPLLKYRMSPGGKSRNRIKSAEMTWRVYRRLGFGVFQSGFFLGSHLVNGLKKYGGK